MIALAKVRDRLGVVALVAFLVVANGVEAQTHVEVRGGFSVGSHSATQAALEMAPALTYEVVLVRQLRPAVSVFGGFLRTAFGCEEGFCTGRDLTVTGTHGAVGAEYRFAAAWLRGGVLVGATEVGTDGESPDIGLGFLGGAGFDVGGARVRFRPGLSMRWLTANTPSRGDHALALTADVGLRVRLGGD